MYQNNQLYLIGFNVSFCLNVVDEKQRHLIGPIKSSSISIISVHS